MPETPATAAFPFVDEFPAGAPRSEVITSLVVKRF